MSDKAKAACGCELDLNTGASDLCDNHMARAHRVPVGFYPIAFIEKKPHLKREERAVVVEGEVESDDESHNCDYMGCGTLSHVVFRGTAADFQKRLVQK